MANILSRNTTNYTGLNQVLVNTQGGLFDFTAQNTAGTVTLTASAVDQVKKAELLNLKPNGANALLTES